MKHFVLPLLSAALILLGIVLYQATSTRAYHAAFIHAGTYSTFPAAEADGLAVQITEYLTGWAEALTDPRFTPAERAHMRDVRALVGLGRNVLLWGTLITLCLLTGAVRTSHSVVIILRRTAFILLGALLVAGVLVGTNFSSAFDSFHAFFFPQGNWAFTQDTLLIQLFPLSYFTFAAWQIALQILGSAACLLLVAQILAFTYGSRQNHMR